MSDATIRAKIDMREVARVLKGIPKRVRNEVALKAFKQATLLAKASLSRQVRKGDKKAVATGHMRGNIRTQLPRTLGDKAEAGWDDRDVPYAKYLDFGTGIHGPKRKVIKPKTAKFLVFQVGQVRKQRRMVGGKTIFAKEVEGIKPRNYTEDAAKEVTDNFQGIAEQALHDLDLV